MARKTQITCEVTLTDGTEFTVTAGTGDMMRYELHAEREKWPAGDRGVWLQTAYCAWSAAKRQGLTDLKWPGFFDVVSACEPVDDQEDDESDDPTPA